MKPRTRREVGSIVALVAMVWMVCEPTFAICVGGSCQRGSWRSHESGGEASCESGGERHGLFGGLFGGRRREGGLLHRSESGHAAGHSSRPTLSRSASEPSCGMESDEVACADDDALNGTIEELDADAFAPPTTEKATRPKPHDDRVHDAVWEIDAWPEQVPMKSISWRFDRPPVRWLTR